MRRRKYIPPVVSALLFMGAVGLLLWASVVLAETSAARRRACSAERGSRPGLAALAADNRFVEGTQALNLTPGNLRGARLNEASTATLTPFDNDGATPPTNPIDTAQFYVRQHYIDFLNREPDA
ncbi:MAG TPA: hypothetical protein VKA61_11505, partial [Sphingomicrobium sp.]|nr:hypothetical protein [Sphingomicrobium sp.]